MLVNEKELHQRKTDSAREGMQFDGTRAKVIYYMHCL